MSKKLAAPLRGIIPPMATPLIDDVTVDVAGVERLVAHILGGGVHGLFLLGTTGEGPSLAREVRRALVHEACRVVKGRVPVLVNVSHASAAESERLAAEAADVGADAVVLSAPFYFPIGQEELLPYFRGLVARMPLPVLLYNMPTHVKVDFSAETVRRMLDEPRVIGFKDSAPGATCFEQVREFAAKQRPDFSLLVGPEALMAQTVAKGAHGSVCAGANIYPKLLVKLYEAAASGDAAKAAELQERVKQIGTKLYSIGGAGVVIRGVKGALASLGICGDYVAPPLLALTETQRQTIAAILAELGIE